MIKNLAMPSRYVFTLLLSFIILLGCAGNKSNQKYVDGYGNNLGDNSTYIDYELIIRKGDQISSENIKSSFYFLNPYKEAWKALYYYQLFFEGTPNIVPETENEIPIVLNGRVNHYLIYFQTKGRKHLSNWLSSSGKYIPMMSEILEQKGLPTDLVYLAMIESGFNVKARSHKAAVGPWQFIKPTAIRYNLRVDSWVDERMNPEKSTIAAANYLGDLYEIFQSWELAAAGYNCGEDRVQKAIDQHNVYDYWLLSEYTLPRETKNYVPKLMAALIIAKDPKKYGFSNIVYQKPDDYDKVEIPPQKSLKDIAKVIGSDPNTLTQLNPSLIRGATPPGTYTKIKVPKGYASVVKEKQNMIVALRNYNIPTYIRYKVRKGDNLGKIAGKYRVSISSIKKKNGIKGSLIRIGQVLKIPKYSSSGSYQDETTTYSYAKSKSTINYRVKSGDTLSEIAERFGTSSRHIKSQNNLRSSKIKIGQILKIPSDIKVSSNDKFISYNVKNGDSLWKIAKKYRVSVSDLKNWNNLSSSKLARGDNLRIYN